MPELTPRDGARIPPKHDQLPPHEKALMHEIEELSKSEAAAMTSLAQSSLRIADASEDSADLLEDIKAIMVKICMKFQIDLPARIQNAIVAQEYSPDEEDEGEDEEEPEGDATGIG